jgi:hypothetical protein
MGEVLFSPSKAYREKSILVEGDERVQIGAFTVECTVGTEK